MFPAGQCQSCHGILDHPCSEGRGEHRALVSHFTDRATETRRAEVSSLRLHPPGGVRVPQQTWVLSSAPSFGRHLGRLCFTASPPLSSAPPHPSTDLSPLTSPCTFIFRRAAWLLLFPGSAPASPSPFLPQQDQERLWSSWSCPSEAKASSPDWASQPLTKAVRRSI